jgi:hypothetical protein
MYYVYKNVHPSFEQSEVELNPAKIQLYTWSSHFMPGFSPEKCCANQTQNSYLQQCILGVRRLTSSPCVVHAYTTVDIQTCKVYMYCIYSIHMYIHFYTWYTHFFKIYLFISNALKM